MLNQKNIIAFALCLAAILTMGAGCSISFKSNDTSAVDGGFWVSLDKGVSWRQVNAVPTVGGVSSINSLDDSSLALDPEDYNAIYFGSAAQGLYYTYSVGSGWTKAAGLNETKINAVVVSPDDKCIIYATAGNKVYRSGDCNRTWTQIYFDNDPTTQINALAVDFYDAHRIYFGNSRGEIGRSIDRGDHWMTVYRSGSSVNQIILSPQDSRKVFVTTVSEGIYRSTDSGDNWTPLKDKMTEFKNSFNIVSLVATPGSDGLLFAATAYGLLKSADAGDTWTRIKLVTPEQQASINSLAVSPKDPREIYYVTNTTFYSSADGGASWRTKKLPSTRAGQRLLIKPDETNVIFMGMKKYQASSGAFGI
ncbi:MAG: hypothetical protein PHO56_04070 [Patescibacteria group bacterium]|nr:hypothetical protein [Patescibacteria group bacterium]